MHNLVKVVCSTEDSNKFKNEKPLKNLVHSVFGSLESNVVSSDRDIAVLLTLCDFCCYKSNLPKKQGTFA